MAAGSGLLPRNLDGTGVEVSALGFGCVRLTTHRDERDALATLEHAFSLGITHFDVARVYGFGRAEAILGTFLRGKRDRVTVATKFGLTPPAGLARSRFAVSLAKKVLGPFPALLRRLKSYGSSQVSAGRFSPQDAVTSLESSLRALGTDYVDVLLLHEATGGEASSAALVDALERQTRRGTIRSFGVASAFDTIAPALAMLPDAYRVLQFENHAGRRTAASVPRSGRGLITHGVFAPARALTDAIAAHPAATDTHSARLGLNLRDGKVIAALLLQYALEANADGSVLFSSTDRAHIGFNVECAERRPFDSRQCAGFLEFVDALLSSGGPVASAAGSGRTTT